MLCELPSRFPYSDFLTVLIPQNSRLAVPSSTRMQTHNLKSQQSLPLSDSSRFQVCCAVRLQLGDYPCQQVYASRRPVRVLLSFFSPLSNEVLGHSSLFFFLSLLGKADLGAAPVFCQVWVRGVHVRLLIVLPWDLDLFWTCPGLQLVSNRILTPY